MAACCRTLHARSHSPDGQLPGHHSSYHMISGRKYPWDQGAVAVGLAVAVVVGEGLIVADGVGEGVPVTGGSPLGLAVGVVVGRGVQVHVGVSLATGVAVSVGASVGIVPSRSPAPGRAHEVPADSAATVAAAARHRTRRQRLGSGLCIRSPQSRHSGWRAASSPRCRCSHRHRGRAGYRKWARPRTCHRPWPGSSSPVCRSRCRHPHHRE